MPPPPAPSLPFAVVVMGVSGCGKSTLGGLLAQALDCPFLEGDAFHAPKSVAKMQSGQPLSDEDRWPWLDRLSQAANASIAAHGVAVLACSALRHAYRDRLRANIDAPVRFVLPDNSRDHLLARLNNRPGHFMPASLLESQLATLERPGADEGALVLAEDVPKRLRDTALQWLAENRQ